MNNITQVYLLNVPLESDYKNTLYFTSKETQSDFFKSKVVKRYTDFSYQRKDSFIRVPDHFDNLQNVNYVMYQNKQFSNKWFYAFITDIKYVDDGRTDVFIETDYIQTWLFDYTIKSSFVEREHVSDDTIGKHTLPENLELGEFICNGVEEDDKGDNLVIYMAISDYAESVNGNIKGNLYGGIYSGMKYHVYNKTTEGINALNNMIKAYDENAKADAINSIFMGPDWLSGVDITDNFIAADVGASTVSKSYAISFNKNTSINGYTPKNKKLLCYPYNYLLCSNNNGNASIYRYEEFTNNKCEFIVDGVLTPGCSIRLHPVFYKNTAKFYDDGINAGKYPICCWNSDVYTNWMTQNGVNNALAIGSGILQVAGGVAMAIGTGGLGLAIGGGSIAGGVGTITNVLAQRHQASLIPDQVRGNTNCGDVITASGINKFIFYKMSIKEEYAKIIDKFFDMFGYQVNMVKVPNKAHRSRYWYTKTIDVNIDGAIPSKDMQVIKDCYNKGITFWRNADEIQNYSLSNGIV